MLPWILFGVSCVIVVALALKMDFMRRGMAEIGEQLRELLADDTNNLIFISFGDRGWRQKSTSSFACSAARGLGI